MGADQGVRHAPPDLTDDIQSLMDSLDEHTVYQIQKGRVLHNDDKVVPDVIAVGLHRLMEGMNTPLKEYNTAFHRLQKHRSMKPVSSSDIPTSASTPTCSTPVPNLTMTLPLATSVTSPSFDHLSHDDSNTMTPSLHTVMESLDDEEIPEEGNNEEETLRLNEVFQIIDNMENGQIDESLPRTSAEDVAFDMDEVIVDEDYYDTDGTTSTSDSDSDSDVLEDIWAVVA